MLAIRALSFSLLGLTPDELSRLAASGTRGWLATDHLTWVLSELKNDAARYAAVVSEGGSQHHKRDGQKEENFQFWHAEMACFAA